MKQHWVEAGKAFPTTGVVTPTSRDPFLGQLEAANILERLDPNYVALEVGCGDASHSVKYARKVKKLSGLDFSEPLLAIARRRIGEEGVDNVDLTAGSILDLQDIYGDAQFDCVISQRCLINLPEWKYQQD